MSHRVRAKAPSTNESPQLHDQLMVWTIGLVPFPECSSENTSTMTFLPSLRIVTAILSEPKSSRPTQSLPLDVVISEAQPALRSIP